MQLGSNSGCVKHTLLMTSNTVATRRAKHLHHALALMSFTGTGNQKMQSWVHSVKQRESRLVGTHKDTAFPQRAALWGLSLAVCSRLLNKIYTQHLDISCCTKPGCGGEGCPIISTYLIHSTNKSWTLARMITCWLFMLRSTCCSWVWFLMQWLKA